MNETFPYACPKCKSTSGNDWSQCGGVCPMPGSPYRQLDRDHLDESDRHVAEAAARVIANAAEMNQPDPPLTPQTVRLVAIAHIELRDAVREIHDRLNQIVRVAIEGALGEVARQQGGIAGTIAKEAISAGMLQAKPFLMSLPRRPRDWTTGPRLVQEPMSKARVDALTADQLLETYCRVMNEVKDVFVQYETYIVRQWDGMDGCWTDCTDDVERGEALRVWAERTSGGTQKVSYDEIDYYRIFPGGTRMHWNECLANLRGRPRVHIRTSNAALPALPEDDPDPTTLENQVLDFRHRVAQIEAREKIGRTVTSRERRDIAIAAAIEKVLEEAYGYNATHVPVAKTILAAIEEATK